MADDGEQDCQREVHSAFDETRDKHGAEDFKLGCSEANVLLENFLQNGSSIVLWVFGAHFSADSKLIKSY